MFYPRTTPDRWRMSVSEEAGPREAPPPEALVRGGEAQPGRAAAAGAAEDREHSRLLH